MSRSTSAGGARLPRGTGQIAANGTKRFVVLLCFFSYRRKDLVETLKRASVDDVVGRLAFSLCLALRRVRSHPA